MGGFGSCFWYGPWLQNDVPPNDQVQGGCETHAVLSSFQMHKPNLYYYWPPTQEQQVQEVALTEPSCTFNSQPVSS